jgi:uncharacterized protein YqgC (DUF456 family)
MGDMATARFKRVMWLLAGWTLLAGGAVGLFLPLPGVALIALGLLVLSTEYVWAHSLIGRLRGRFPKTVGAMEKYSTRTAGQ